MPTLLSPHKLYFSIFYVPDFMPHLMTVLRSTQLKTVSSAIPMSAMVTKPAKTSGVRKK